MYTLRLVRRLERRRGRAEWVQQ